MTGFLCLSSFAMLVADARDQSIIDSFSMSSVRGRGNINHWPVEPSSFLQQVEHSEVADSFSTNTFRVQGKDSTDIPLAPLSDWMGATPPEDSGVQKYIKVNQYPFLIRVSFFDVFMLDPRTYGTSRRGWRRELLFFSQGHNAAHAAPNAQ